MSTTKANDSLSTVNVDSESSLWAAAVAVGLPLYVYMCMSVCVLSLLCAVKHASFLFFGNNSAISCHARRNIDSH